MLEDRLMKALKRKNSMTEYCRTEIHINGRQPLPYKLAITEYEDRENWLPIEMPEGVFFELHTTETDEHWTNDSNREVFVCPYHIVVLDEAEDEFEGHFLTEDEAVRFVLETNRYIPRNLTTMGEINDYCTDNGLNVLWYYSKTEISNICPPITTKMIKCLLEATHIQ